jgi:hypothetical protein
VNEYFFQDSTCKMYTTDSFHLLFFPSRRPHWPRGTRPRQPCERRGGARQGRQEGGGREIHANRDVWQPPLLFITAPPLISVGRVRQARATPFIPTSLPDQHLLSGSRGQICRGAPAPLSATTASSASGRKLLP